MSDSSSVSATTTTITTTARKDRLELAETILWKIDPYSDECVRSRELSTSFVKSLTNLYDSLRDAVVLGDSSWIGAHRRCLRWSSTKLAAAIAPSEGDPDENDPARKPTTTTMVLLDTEANLYRALWLTCLVILSVLHRNETTTTTTSPQQHRKRKRPSRSASDDNMERTLKTTIQRCRLLVRVLEQVQGETVRLLDTSKDVSATTGDSNNPWNDRIKAWTDRKDDNNGTEDEEEDDGSLNLLSLTKEQLEAEELELLMMATTPIPTGGAHFHRLQKQTPSQQVASPDNLPLRAKLMGVEGMHATTLPVPIELDDTGILRAGGDWLWSLTSQSFVVAVPNEHDTIEIHNVFSNRGIDVTRITLGVVATDTNLWKDRVAAISTTGHNSSCLTNTRKVQEEVAELWPMDEVIAALKRANQEFSTETSRKQS